MSNITIEIEAGDMLYLPAGWWHHIVSNILRGYRRPLILLNLTE